jgi:hypothetical protein
MPAPVPSRAKPYSLYAVPSRAGGDPPPEMQRTALERLRRGNHARKRKDRAVHCGAAIAEAADHMLAGKRRHRTRLHVEHRSTLLHPCASAIKGVGLHSHVGVHEENDEAENKPTQMWREKLRPSHSRTTIVRL